MMTTRRGSPRGVRITLLALALAALGAGGAWYAGWIGGDVDREAPTDTRPVQTAPAASAPVASAPALTAPTAPADAAPADAAPGAAAAGDPPVPLLWKAERGGNAVYLLGSLHVLRPSDYPLHPAVDAAFDDAERLAFELDPVEVRSPALASEMLRRARFEGGATLMGSVPEAGRAALADALRRHQLPPESVDGMEPWFVGVMLALRTAMEAGFDPNLGLDGHLMQRGEAAGKPAIGLERASDQFDAIEAPPLDEQVAALLQSLEADDMGAELEALHARWRAGDAAALEETLVAELRALPATWESLNVERNQRWLPQVEAMLARGDEDDTLVVVGALHLLGEEGLVEQLRARGVSVERVAGPAGAD